VDDHRAGVDGDRVAPVRRLRGPEAGGDQVERLVPADRLEVARRRAPDRAAQAARIGLEVQELGALRADEASRQRVVRVRLHLDRATVLDLERQPAAGLAKRADAVLLAGGLATDGL
jgi:hypothetical protein